MLFSGNPVAERILRSTQQQISETKVTPGLGVILVGDDAPSHLYVGIKERRAQELGIYFEKKVFPKTASQEEIEKAIVEMNGNDRLHGIIVQIPLPAHLDTEKIIEAIDPQKDTDGFHPFTIEKFLAGDSERLPVFPRAMIEMVRVAEPEKKRALAVVNSSLMGEVLRAALLQEGFTAQYIFGTEKEKLAELLPDQSVVLTAVGIPGMLSSERAQAGAILIDGGIYYDEEGNVIGDVARDDGVYRDDVRVTPVPGGVGPVTVAVLLARVAEASLRVKLRPDEAALRK